MILKECLFCKQPARLRKQEFEHYNLCQSEVIWTVGCDTDGCWCNVQESEN